MNPISRILAALRRKSELQEELQSHLNLAIADRVARGESPGTARREALREFGNLPLIADVTWEGWRERWGWLKLEHFAQDLKYALHQLRKSPGFAITGILTLAIGIGANTTVFTLIDALMLRSLPVSRPGELVSLGLRAPKIPNFINGQSLSIMGYLSRHTASLEAVAPWNGSMVTFPDDRGTLRSIGAALVSGNALSVLGVRPYMGRLLTPADDVVGGPEGGWPVVLDYGFWLANFHGDPNVLGRHLRVSSYPAIIVGVLPPNFSGVDVGNGPKLYMPARFLTPLAGSSVDDPYAHPEDIRWLALGRLRPGASLATLNAELAAASPSVLKALLPPKMLAQPDFRQATLAAESASRGLSGLRKQYGAPLFLLQGMVFLVLLLCCVNLGGLQLARVQARQHEYAVRAALGAGRGRILRQCLVESLLLALLGSAAAAAVAWFSTGALGAFLTPAGSGEATTLRPDSTILLVVAALAVVATLLFGFAPALAASGAAPASLLQAKATQRRGNTLRQRLFIPAQFALALVLVFGAALFSQTLVRLRGAHAGFDPSRVMEVCAQFQALKKSPEEIAQLYRSMTDALRASPGVEAASYTWVTPLTDFAPQLTAHSMGRPREDHSLAFNEVGDGYFSTIGTRLLAGREFTPDDRDRSTCVINQAAVRLLFAGGSALGESIKTAPGTASHQGQFHVTTTCRVVGLAEDARYASLREPPPPTIYFPAGAATLAQGGYSNNLVFFIRSRTPAEATTAYRGALARYAPETSYMTFLPLADQVDQSLGSERLIAALSEAFAVVALLLSAVGLFGVLAIRVRQRTPEMGIRLAVGATRANLLALVFREAFGMVAVGALVGAAFCAAGAALVRRFLYETAPADPGAAGGALTALLIAALAAALHPAIRAASLSPTEALRDE